MPDTCETCGAVCCRALYFPPFQGFELQRLPNELYREVQVAYEALAAGNVPEPGCLWLDKTSNRCRHYDRRPKVCRDCAVEGPICRMFQQRARKNP